MNHITLPAMVFRSVKVTIVFVIVGLQLLLESVELPQRRKSAAATTGHLLADAFERLGGAFVKLGQLLSTRQDLFAVEFLQPLERLQDQVKPLPGRQARQVVSKSLARRVEDVFSEFAELPIASASIGQVHRAVMRDNGREVVVKIRRPGVARLYADDIRILQLGLSILTRLPLLRGIPIREGFGEICQSLLAQTDFENEASSHRTFKRSFSGESRIRIPELVDQMCNSEILVMEYLPGLVKISDAALPYEVRYGATVIGLRALYKMLFVDGAVHCDLHPGNILLAPDGRVALLDFGFVASADTNVRQLFAEFFLSIAFNDGLNATRILLETAVHVPASLDREALELDICRLVDDGAGKRAGGFLVAQFVNSLFQVQRKHGIYASSDFTLPIFALLVYEGMVRPHFPCLDFQREAVPVLLSALEEDASGRPNPN